MGLSCHDFFCSTVAQKIPIGGLFKSHFNTAFVHDVIPSDRLIFWHMDTSADFIQHILCQVRTLSFVIDFCIVQQNFCPAPDDTVLRTGISFIIVDVLLLVEKLCHIITRLGDTGSGGRTIFGQICTSHLFAVVINGIVNIHDVAIPSGAVIEDVGIEAIVASVVRMLGIISGTWFVNTLAVHHTILIDMVMGGYVGTIGATK